MNLTLNNMSLFEINYFIGDATNPLGEGRKVIVHVCNDIGKWGAGFVLALSKKWKEPENSYKRWFASSSEFLLGQVQFVQVEEDIFVANLIGQAGIRNVITKNHTPPVRYDAIEQGLVKIADFAQDNAASVHMPRIGCGLAGGDWTMVEAIIYRTLVLQEILVNVYDLQ